MNKVVWTINICPICGLEVRYECEHLQRGSQPRNIEVVSADVLRTVSAVAEIEIKKLREELKNATDKG